MDDLSNIIVRLNTTYTSLNNIQIAAKNTEKQINSLIESFSKLGSVSSSVSSKTHNTMKKFNKDISSVSKRINGLKTNFLNSFNKMSSSAQTNISKITKEIKKFDQTNTKSIEEKKRKKFDPKSFLPSLKTNFQKIIDHSQITAPLQNLLNQEQGEKLFGGIKQYSLDSGYNSDEMVKSATEMRLAGVDIDKIVPTFKTLGDIAMGDISKFKELTYVFTNMSKTGNISRGELTKLESMGLRPLEEISKITGKSISELDKNLDNGKITTAQIEQALQAATLQNGIFHNSINNINNTVGGKFNKLMNKTCELFNTLYETAGPFINILLNIGNNIIDKIIGGFNAFINEIREGNNVFIGIAMALGVLATGMAAAALYTTIMTAAIWGNIAALLVHPVTWIVIAIVALVAIIGYLIYRFDGWGEAWNSLMTVSSALWNMFLSNLKLQWVVVEDFLLSGIEKLQKAYLKFQTFLGNDSAQSSLTLIEKKSEERKNKINAAKENLSNSKDNLFNAWNNATFLKDSNKSLKDYGKTIKNKFQGLFPGLKFTSSGKELSDTTKNKKNNAKPGSGAKTNSSIATGGQRTNYITINLQNLVEQINIKKGEFKETTNQMEEMVADSLLRVLALADTTSGN